MAPDTSPSDGVHLEFHEMAAQLNSSPDLLPPTHPNGPRRYQDRVIDDIRTGKRRYADILPDSSGMPDESRHVPRPPTERGWTPIGVTDSSVIVFTKREHSEEADVSDVVRNLNDLLAKITRSGGGQVVFTVDPLEPQPWKVEVRPDHGPARAPVRHGMDPYEALRLVHREMFS